MSDDTGKQVQFWNEWNSSTREQSLSEVSHRQEREVAKWLSDMGRHDLSILEVGCGAGWLSPTLQRYGPVTGTDLADEVLDRARSRFPEVQFVAGDFMELQLATSAFDVVVALEVLSHVPDQSAFLAKLAGHLKPNGELLLATQNRPVLERFNQIPPPGPGQIRKWVDRSELTELLRPHFSVLEMFTVTPRANRGLMRIVNSKKMNTPIRALVGDRVDRLKERAGLGWTIMCRARRTH